MQQAALNKPGYGVRIVYNLASGHIFKYNVYLEPGCNGEEPQAVASKSDGDSTCRTPLVIEWMPIDTVMLAPFAAMVEPEVFSNFDYARNYFNTHSSLLNSDPSLAVWIYDVLAPLRNLQISD
jgi:hypothetical protein